VRLLTPPPFQPTLQRPELPVREDAGLLLLSPLKQLACCPPRFGVKPFTKPHRQMEAAELLGVSERTFRRWCQRFEEAGEVGLLDRRLGKTPGKRVPLDREQEVCPYTGLATAASRRGISTNTLSAIIGSTGATRGGKATGIQHSLLDDRCESES
jgi:hypothetical protein